MNPTPPRRPRAKLNRDAVWELPGRPGISWNGPARRSYGNAAGLHHPRPGDGRIRGITLSLRRPNPGRSQATAAILPGPPSLPRGVLLKESPHHSGEHGQPQRPRTHGCGNTGLPGGFPAPHGRGGMRLRSPAARGPGGKTPAASGPRRDGAIREPHRPHRLDHPDHPGRVPLHHQPTRRTPAA